MAVEREDSSSHYNEATFAFPTSGMTRGARVGPHMVLATCLISLAHLIMPEGERM